MAKRIRPVPTGVNPPYPVAGSPPMPGLTRLGKGGNITGAIPAGSLINASAFVGPHPHLQRSYSGSLETDSGNGGSPSNDFLNGFFLSRFQPQQVRWWHRKISVQGSTVISTGTGIGTTGRVTVDRIPSGFGLIILSWKQFWARDNCDVLNPSNLECYNTCAASNGRTSHNLLINGAPIYDNKESLYDPTAAATNITYGFTTLNENLLYMGPHPTAIYVRDNSLIQGAWYTRTTVPDGVPQVVGLELDGWIMPAKMFYEVIAHTRIAT